MIALPTIDQMRELELAIQDIYQPLFIPALLMLVGGVLNGIGKARGPSLPKP